MFWSDLTGDQFSQAVNDAQRVCLLPLSCIERHGHHLPLGTDMLIGRELCRRAAVLEPALIFPDFIFTQILEAQHVAGTIAIQPELITALLENVCREIARNGLDKIVIVNAHGGNDHWIHYFAQTQLAMPRPYVVYVPTRLLDAQEQAALDAQWESKVDGHAGEQESSAILAIRPALVDRHALRTDDEGMPLERLKGLRDLGVGTGIWWYADHPTHYRGDANPATAEKGERMLDAYARALANVIRAIKQDGETRRLQDEFFQAAAQH
jgi:creatinine amidohydrolase